MSDVLINQFIDEPALAGQKARYLAGIKEMQDSIRETHQLIQQLYSKTNMSGVSRGVEQVNTSLNKLRTAYTATSQEGAKLVSLQNQQATSEAKLVQSGIQFEQQNLRVVKGVNDRTKAEREAEAQEKRNKKIVDELTNDYLQLSKAYNDAALKYKNYALTLGEGHPATLAAQQDAKGMYDILYKLDRNVGQFGRNVGNYKSGFDGLGMSFTQIARELPSLTISVQQFFLAISNNLPMVFDEVAKARKEIEELRAAGEKTPSLFSRVVQSALSMQVALSVGVALLTAVGPLLINYGRSLFDNAYKAEKLAEMQRKLNAEYREYIALIRKYKEVTGQALPTDPGIGGNVRENVQAFRIAQLKEEIKQLERLSNLSSAQGKTQSELLAIETKLAGVRKESAKLTFEREGGQAAVYKALAALDRSELAYQKSRNTYLASRSEKDEKAMQEAKTEFDFRSDNYVRLSGLANDYYKTIDDLAVAEAEQSKAARDRAREEQNFQYEINILRLQRQKEFYQKQADDESVAFDTRIAFLGKSNEIENKILEQSRLRDLNVENISAKQREKINTDYYNKRLKNAADAADKEDTLYREYSENTKKQLEDIVKAEEEAAKKRAQARKEFTKGQIASISAGGDAVIAQINTNYASEQAALYEQYHSREIDRATLEKNLLDLKVKYDTLLIEQEIRTASALLAIANLSFTDKANFEKKLAELKLKLLKEDEKNDEEATNKAKQRRIKALTDIQSLVSNLTQSITNLADIGFNARAAALEKEATAIEKNGQAELDRINSENISTEEKANKTILAEARIQAKKDEVNRKQKQNEQERARFQKAADIANIITTTALAVVRTLADNTIIPGFLRIPMAVTVGALGAAQLAKAIATPIAAYAKGRKGGPAELAITDEKGPELYIRKDGSMYMGSNDGPTFRMLEEGTQVIPAHQARETLARNLQNHKLIWERKPVDRKDPNTRILNGILKETKRSRRKPEDRSDIGKIRSAMYEYEKIFK